VCAGPYTGEHTLKKQLLILAAAGAMLTLLVVLFTRNFVGSRPYPNETELAQYRETCSPIISWLEEQRSISGRYPGALREDQLTALKEIDPLTSYRVFGREPSQFFELSIGDYSRYHWVYFYHSSHGEWFTDR